MTINILKNDLRYTKFGIKEPAKEKPLKKKRNWRKIWGRAALAATGAAAVGGIAFAVRRKHSKKAEEQNNKPELTSSQQSPNLHSSTAAPAGLILLA